MHKKTWFKNNYQIVVACLPFNDYLSETKEIYKNNFDNDTIIMTLV